MINVAATIVFRNEFQSIELNIEFNENAVICFEQAKQLKMLLNQYMYFVHRIEVN